MRDFLELNPVDNEWELDYPCPLNYVLRWEYGAFYLSQRPNYCDRGHWNLICDNWGLAEGIIPFMSQYFMDLEIAKLEVSQWIKLVRHFTQNRQKPGEKEWVKLSHFASQDLDIEICCARGANLIKVEAIALGDPPILDSQDGFPRYYLNDTIAFQETSNWLKHRKLEVALVEISNFSAS